VRNRGCVTCLTAVKEKKRDLRNWGRVFEKDAKNSVSP